MRMGTRVRTLNPTPKRTPTVVHNQNQGDADVIREVRARNPGATILATTDWNAGGFFRNDLQPAGICPAIPARLCE